MQNNILYNILYNIICDKMKMIDKFIEIYIKPKFVVLNILFTAAYYYLFLFIVQLQDKFMFINTPLLLIYLLIISSSILLTMSIYLLLNSGFSYKKGSTTALSFITTFIGSIVSGCGCTAPILFSLASIGFSSSQLVLLDNFFALNQTPIILAMVIINFLFILYIAAAKEAQACGVHKHVKQRQ